MQFATRVLVRLAPLAVLSTLTTPLTGCSDGPAAPVKQAYTPPDAAVTVPPEPAPQPPILIVLKGYGEVLSPDGAVNCTPDAGVDGCTPKHVQTTLYAKGILPWMFDHWEPSMSTDPTEYVASWSGPLTAVFVPIPGLDGGQR
jgi:hypothetical protein